MRLIRLALPFMIASLITLAIFSLTQQTAMAQQAPSIQRLDHASFVNSPHASLLSAPNAAPEIRSPQAPLASTVLSRTLSLGDELIHGLTYYQGYLWGSTRYPIRTTPEPARIVKINPSTLTVVSRVDLGASQTDGEDIEGAQGYIWTVLFTNPAQLIRVNPNATPLTYQTALTFTGVGYGTSLDYSSGYLWVGLQDHIAQVDISDPTNPTYVLHDYSGLAADVSVLVNALSHDDTHLWAALYQCNASTPAAACFTANTVMKIDPGDPSNVFTTTTVTTLFPDDMAFVNQHLYVSSEALVPSDMYQFAADVTTYTTTHVSNDQSYGTFANPLDPFSVWSTFTSTPGYLRNFDLEQNQTLHLPLPMSYSDPAEIVFDPAGNMYVTTWQMPTGILKYPAPISATLDISHTATEVGLSWVHNEPDATSYQVWRSTDPYFSLGDPGAVMIAELTPPFDATLHYTDTAGIGDVNTNYFYGIVTRNAYNLSSPLSNRVGEFDFELRETAGTDFNWVSLPFSTTLTMASDLKNHIEANSSTAITVFTVEEWNPIAQSYQTFTTIPFPLGDFSLKPGGAYRISVDITGSSSSIWSLSGGVPDPADFSYTIRETAGTDFNWLMLPLDRGNDVMASDFKVDLETNCTPSGTFFTIEQWNPIAQSYQTFTTIPFPLGDFATRIGYTYRVSVDVSSATSCVWP